MEVDNLCCVSNTVSRLSSSAPKSSKLYNYVNRKVSKKASLAKKECATTEVGLEPEILSDLFWMLEFFWWVSIPFSLDETTSFAANLVTTPVAE